MLPISLLRSEYQGWEYQKEKPIQDRAKMRAKKNLLLTEKYKSIPPKIYNHREYYFMILFCRFKQ